MTFSKKNRPAWGEGVAVALGGGGVMGGGLRFSRKVIKHFCRLPRLLRSKLDPPLKSNYASVLFPSPS